jgi:hypothetical protein
MSQYQQGGHGDQARRVDEYGNPVSQQVDQYGNPISSVGHGHGQQQQHHGIGGVDQTAGTGYGTHTGTTLIIS